MRNSMQTSPFNDTGGIEILNVLKAVNLKERDISAGSFISLYGFIQSPATQKKVKFFE